VGTDDFLFPRGAGIHVLPGKTLLLVMDEANDADQAVTAQDEIQVLLGAPADVVNDAEMVLLGTTNIDIPNNGKLQTASGAAQLLHDRTILAALPVMRTLGVHQQLTRTPINADPVVVLDTDFDPQQQIFHLLADVDAVAGDRLEVGCSYVNTGPVTLTFGVSQTDEFCFSALYLSPSFEVLLPNGFNGHSF
jgi:hypothetical protein